MKTRVLLEGLAFPEGPRWREGRLWLTDQHAHEVVTVDLQGRAERVVTGMEDRPGGLGWLPDGTPLVVGMTRRRIHRIADGRLELHADLHDLASWHCNDMVVDDVGRAYVGNFGYDVDAGAPPRPAELILVEPNGQARVVSRDVVFPNGMGITPDRRTLLVNETFAHRISAFRIEEDGSLSGHRLWADVGEATPDGLCLDAEGAVWFACTTSGRLYRVLEGQAPSEPRTPRTPPYACMLGGPDRRTLFSVGAATHVPEEAARLRSGTVEAFEVEVPGAGLP
ncbi:MAG: SMP-30/gluconolactonase/LRE family protein [Sandaracinaceae bacterium]